MAATTLLETGYRDVNLGADLPIDSLIAAVKQNQARLVWLSCSVTKDRPAFLRDVQRLAETCAAGNATLVLGGRGVYGTPLPAMPSTHVIASMAELAALARGLRASEPNGVDRRPLTPAAR